MYRIHKEQFSLYIDCGIGLEFFPDIYKLAYFESNIPGKFLLKAHNKTKDINKAEVIVRCHYKQSEVINFSNAPKILFCANKDDLIKYTIQYENTYNMCPVNVFEFEALDFDLPEKSIDRVFFSSKRAFDFFVKKAGMSFLCGKELFAVGKQTAEYIKNFGFSVKHPSIYTSSELDLKDTLVVCPKEHGVYDEKAIVLEVYQTLMAKDIDYYTYDCDFDFALVSSPLAFKYLIDTFKDYPGRVKKNIICIGTTTQKAVEKFGYSCIIPKEFTIPAMFKLLEDLN
ncbi:uroporphyrinogen-III synthase [Desulfurella sp.]|uniref:uroporphyrinogen-III synthase n=1 Tax=Desulfurella sp. TaxID=1962857 RepID=UPI0025C637CF|nr:uroporphyrinogen-III synthase [Desulfurella sp.]